MNQVQARPLAERRKAAMERLRSNSNLWLATASDGRGPHLIPLSYWWDGSRLTTATFEGSRTLKNVCAPPKVHAAIGTTGDVLMIDATATIARSFWPWMNLAGFRWSAWPTAASWPAPIGAGPVSTGGISRPTAKA